MALANERKSRHRFHLQIDPIRCDGYGYCVELMPEYLEFDDWGFPLIKERQIGSLDALELARRVEHLCPKIAFRVVDTKV